MFAGDINLFYFHRDINILFEVVNKELRYIHYKEHPQNHEF